AGQGRGAGGGRGVQVVSPEVHPDKTVTVRFRAPNAKTVELIGEIEGKPSYAMTKDEATGVWSVTVGPLPHDVYNYQFRVDAANGQGGVIAMDPQNPWIKIGFGGFPSASQFEIPGNGLEFDDAKPVPRDAAECQPTPSRFRTGRCVSRPTSRRRSARRGRCGSTRRPATSAAPRSI